jgi:hypothetical protein
MRAGRAQQNGVVLFVALIAMVVLSLAGVALLRATDAGTSVAGNLAFRQSSMALINIAVEQATDDLFYHHNIADTTIDDTAHNYYATLQPIWVGGVPGVPPDLKKGSYPGAFQKITDANTGNTATWVIERLCTIDGDPLVNIGRCDVLLPKISPGKTTMKGGGPPVNPQPIFRQTIRIDGPSNTVTYAQAMLR